MKNLLKYTGLALVCMLLPVVGCSDSDDEYDPGWGGETNCSGAGLGQACYHETLAPNAPLCNFCVADDCIGGTYEGQPITFCSIECSSNAQCTDIFVGGCCALMSSGGKSFCVPGAFCGSSKGGPGDACEGNDSCQEGLECLGSSSSGYFCAPSCTSDSDCGALSGGGCCIPTDSGLWCIPSAMCGQSGIGQSCSGSVSCHPNMECIGNDELGYFCSIPCSDSGYCQNFGFACCANAGDLGYLCATEPFCG